MCGFVLVINGNPFFLGNSYFVPGFPAVIRPGRFLRCFPLSNFYAMKHGGNVSTHTINQLCRLLQCRVQDVMEYIDEE